VLLGEGIDQIDFFLNSLPALEGPLGLRLIGPEVRLRNALLELDDFVTWPSSLKDNS